MRILHIDSRPRMRGGQWQVLRVGSAEFYARRGSKQAAAGTRRRAGCAFTAHHRLDVTPLAMSRWCAAQADLVHAHDARRMPSPSGARPAPAIVARRVAFPVGRGNRLGLEVRARGALHSSTRVRARA